MNDVKCWALIVLISFLSACASTPRVELPLHAQSVKIPSSIPVAFREDYVAGYKSGWIGMLQTFAADIDYVRGTQFGDHFVPGVIVRSIGTVFGEGQNDAEEDADKYVTQLVAEKGRHGAQEYLRANVPSEKVPNHPTEPASPSRGGSS